MKITSRTNIPVKVLKGVEADSWKALMWCVDRMVKTHTPADIVDGIVQDY